MRCNNCGWDNPDTNLKCVKCNAPLVAKVQDGQEQHNSRESNNLNSTVREDLSSLNSVKEATSENASFLNKTVCESTTPSVAQGTVQETIQDDCSKGCAINEIQSREEVKEDVQQGLAQAKAQVCPSCGYPLRPGVNICPNCGKDMEPKTNLPHAANDSETAKSVAESKVADSEVSDSVAESNTVSSSFTGTINPWLNIKPEIQEPRCSLTPIRHSSETVEPQSKIFDGNSHSLNRSNLDANNGTITSNVQARLTFENGEWMIEDASSQQTTFIHVGSKTPLKDGDIILMGNRQFVFKTEGDCADGQ